MKKTLGFSRDLGSISIWVRCLTIGYTWACPWAWSIQSHSVCWRLTDRSSGEWGEPLSSVKGDTRPPSWYFSSMPLFLALLRAVESCETNCKIKWTFDKFPGFPEILVGGFRISCLFPPDYKMGFREYWGIYWKFPGFCTQKSWQRNIPINLKWQFSERQHSNQRHPWH